METVHGVGTVPTFELRHRLRLAREFAGLEQRDLSEQSGISRATISAGETGAARPHGTTMRLWAMVCGVDYNWLATGAGSCQGRRRGKVGA